MSQSALLNAPLFCTMLKIWLYEHLSKLVRMFQTRMSPGSLVACPGNWGFVLCFFSSFWSGAIVDDQSFLSSTALYPKTHWNRQGMAGEQVAGWEMLSLMRAIVDKWSAQEKIMAFRCTAIFNRDLFISNWWLLFTCCAHICGCRLINGVDSTMCCIRTDVKESIMTNQRFKIRHLIA